MNWLVMLGALILDRVLQEPKRFHPLVGFGHWAVWLENRCNSKPDASARALLMGLFATLIAVLPALLLWWLLATWLPTWLNDLFWLTLCVGFHSLLQHAQQVATAATRSIVEARQAVAMMVSRDTEEMNPSEISAATIESTLENGNDAVFATLFWYICLGSWAALLHRLINTLDAMWGYKTPRFLWFGRAAAKLDDWINWIPARITACLYAFSGNTACAFKAWRTQAHKLSSPNGGATMTSGGGALNLQLGGPCRYHGEVLNKPFFGGEFPPVASDIESANQLLRRSVALFIAFSAVISGALLWLK